MDTSKMDAYLQLPYSIQMLYVEKGEYVLQPYYFGTIEELPGCVAHGHTEEELLLRMHEAKKRYFAKLLQQNEDIPLPGNMRLRDWDRLHPRSSRTRVRLRGWTHD